MNYGDRLGTLRKTKKMTQEELASRLYVADKTVSSWESGRTEPSMEMIIKLSEILECGASYLLHGDNLKDNIEMEIKVELSKEEYDRLNKFMNSEGTFLLESNQQDTYYQSDEKDKFINRWLRIRKSGNKQILTYKNHNSNMYSEEYEVEVDNSDNLGKIFGFIGLKEIVTVKKNRKMYSYLNKYEVSLDKVSDLGYFIEIEVKESISDYEKEYDELLRNSKLLGLNLNNIVKKRYPQLMIDKKIKSKSGKNWEEKN